MARTKQKTHVRKGKTAAPVPTANEPTLQPDAAEVEMAGIDGGMDTVMAPVSGIAKGSKEEIAGLASEKENIAEEGDGKRRAKKRSRKNRKVWDEDDGEKAPEFRWVPEVKAQVKGSEKNGDVGGGEEVMDVDGGVQGTGMLTGQAEKETKPKMSSRNYTPPSAQTKKVWALAEEALGAEVIRAAEELAQKVDNKTLQSNPRRKERRERAQELIEETFGTNKPKDNSTSTTTASTPAEKTRQNAATRKAREIIDWRASIRTYLTQLSELHGQEAVDEFFSTAPSTLKPLSPSLSSLRSHVLNLHNILRRTLKLSHSIPTDKAPHTLLPVPVRTAVETRLGASFWLDNARYDRIPRGGNITSKTRHMIQWLRLEPSVPNEYGGYMKLDDVDAGNVVLAMSSCASSSQPERVISVMEIALREVEAKGTEGEEVVSWWKYVCLGGVMREMREKRKGEGSGGKRKRNEDVATNGAENEAAQPIADAEDEEEWGGIDITESKDNNDEVASEAEAFETMDVDSNLQGQGKSGTGKMRRHPVLTVWLSRKPIPEFKDAFGETEVKVAQWKESGNEEKEGGGEAMDVA